MALLTRRSIVQLGAGTAGCVVSLLGCGHPHATPWNRWPRAGLPEVVVVDRSQGVVVLMDRDLIPSQILLVAAPAMVAAGASGSFYVAQGREGWAGGAFRLVEVASGPEGSDGGSPSIATWNLPGVPSALGVDSLTRAWLVGDGKQSLLCCERGNLTPLIYPLPAGISRCWLRAGRVLFLRGNELCWAELNTLNQGGEIQAVGGFSDLGMDLTDLAVHPEGLLLLGDVTGHRDSKATMRVVQRRTWDGTTICSQRVGEKAERIELRGREGSSLRSSAAWLIHARSRLVELLPVPGERSHRISTGRAEKVIGIEDHRGSLLLASPTGLRRFGWDGRLLATQGGFDHLGGLTVLSPGGT